MSRWTDDRIEDLLAKAVEEATPDVFEAAASAQPEYEPIVFEPLRRKKKNRAPLWGMLAACLVLAVGIGGWNWITPEAVLTIRVNPALELTVNHWGRIIETAPLNEDGAELLWNTDLKYDTLEQAVSELSAELEKGGYLEDGKKIIVSVRGADYRKAEERGREAVAELAIRTGVPVSLGWENETDSWPEPAPPAEESPSPGMEWQDPDDDDDWDDDHDDDDHDDDDHDDDDDDDRDDDDDDYDEDRKKNGQ